MVTHAELVIMNQPGIPDVERWLKVIGYMCPEATPVHDPKGASTRRGECENRAHEYSNWLYWWAVHEEERANRRGRHCKHCGHWCCETLTEAREHEEK